MSDRVKAKLGEELYNQVIEKIKPNEFDLVDGWIPRTRLNEESDKVKNLSVQIETMNKQIESAKTLINDNEELKTKYSTLETKYNDDLNSSKKELLNISKKYQLENNLITNGAKFTKLLMKEIDFNSVELDKTGNVINAQNIIDGLKKEYSELFTTKVNDSGDFKKPDNSKSNDAIDWESKFNKFKGGSF